MEDGLRPSTPPGRERAFARRSETLDLNSFPKALKRMGVWGLRPQRVQGRALAFLVSHQPQPPSPRSGNAGQMCPPCMLFGMARRR